MDNKLDDLLINAVRYGDPTRVSYFLNLGADVNAIDETTKESAAVIACEMGHIAALETLLVYGLDPLTKNKDGQTLIEILAKRKETSGKAWYNFAIKMVQKYLKGKSKKTLWDRSTQFYLGERLIEAVKEGDIELVKSLIERGANIWHQNRLGQTPFDVANFNENDEVCSYLSDKINLHQSLIIALYNSDNKKIRAILDKGAHPMSYDQYGHPAILIAGQKGNFEAVDMLVKKGVDVNVMDDEANTLMTYAVRLQDAHFVDYLFSNGFMPERVRVSYQKDIETAIKQGDLYITQQLIENTGSIYVQTATAMAIYYGADKVLPYLMEKGGSIIHCESNVHPLAIEIIHSNNPKMLDFVLSHGAQVNQMDSQNRWPLLEAVKQSSSEMVQILIKHKARIDRVNNDGWTALMEACKLGNEEMVSLLLKAGAEVNKKNKYGWTPMMVAAQQGNYKVGGILYTHGARVDTLTYDDYSPLSIAVEAKNTDMARHLLFWGADRLVPLDHGVKVLHAAIVSKDKTIIRDLIQYGVGVNSINEETGRTALMESVLQKDVEVVKQLLEVGADLSIQDKFGRTALRYAYDLLEISSNDAVSLENANRIVCLLKEAEINRPIALNKIKHNKNIDRQNV